MTSKIETAQTIPSLKNAVKDELKVENKALQTEEKYYSARQFILREMVEEARGLRDGEALTEGKGRRILAREVLSLLSTTPAAKLPDVERPVFNPSMTPEELVDGSIDVLKTRIANVEARIARLKLVERLTTEAAYRHLDNAFDISGREFAWKVIETWENDPFTKYTRPGVPQNF